MSYTENGRSNRGFHELTGTKIEITPAMIDAGVDALLEYEDGDGSTLSERVVEVFLAMSCASSGRPD